MFSCKIYHMKPCDRLTLLSKDEKFKDNFAQSLIISTIIFH